MLLQNAEARQLATPPPTATQAAQEESSGLIDILGMQRRAQEERASADAVATRTPVPTVSTVRNAETDPDLVAALAGAERRKKRVLLAGLAGALVVGAIAVGVVAQSSHGAAAAAQTAVAQAPAVVAPLAPAVVPPPPDPVVAAVAPVAAAPVAAPASDSSVAPPAKSKKGKSHKHAAKSKGLKLTKVPSSGVAP
jgi:hypothetical protein